jgi:hypothetical protein
VREKGLNLIDASQLHHLQLQRATSTFETISGDWRLARP